jgi:hypothetical protein
MKRNFKKNFRLSHINPHGYNVLTYLHIYLIGWFTETHFAEFPCYPSLNYFSPIQITTVKSFGPIRYDLDRLILYSPTKCSFVRYFAYLVRKKTIWSDKMTFLVRKSDGPECE